MSLIQMNSWSSVLGIQVPTSVIMPNFPNRNNPPKVLYLLHGLSDDNTIWSRRTNIERYFEGKNICIVMPCGQRSFYTNMKNGYAFWTYLSIELPKMVMGTYNVSDKIEDTYAAGISMGGYGAIKLGLRRSSQFSKIWGISAAIDMDKHKDIYPEFNNTFGDSISDDNNLFKLLDKAYNNGVKLPEMHLYCGIEDGFHEDNVRFVQKAKEYSYNITFSDEHANHGWDYWDKVVKNISEKL